LPGRETRADYRYHGTGRAYLSKLLLGNGYKVYGVDRRTSLATTDRLHYLGVVDDVTLLDAAM